MSEPASKVSEKVMNLEQFCRRQYQLRTEGIRAAIEAQQNRMNQVVRSFSDSDRIERESANRLMRAKGQSQG